ncbi:MAG: hypothetical protein Q4A66_08175, partial [Eubacteriales bacterium]|nr:hypothetical protein [Eubacteriales bacterium]
FADEEYTALYHEYFRLFLETVDPQELIEQARQLIAPYAEKDPSAFYTYEEFEAAAAALQEFCGLRVPSIEGQLAGQIPATDEGQRAAQDSLVDASVLQLSVMGSQGGGKDAGQRGEFSMQGGGFVPPEMTQGTGGADLSGMMQGGGFVPPEITQGMGGFAPPGGMQRSAGSAQPETDPEEETQPDEGAASEETSAAEIAPTDTSASDQQAAPEATSSPDAGGSAQRETTRTASERESRTDRTSGMQQDAARVSGAGAQAGSGLLPIAISLAVLLGGLLFAFLFRR